MDLEMKSKWHFPFMKIEFLNYFQKMRVTQYIEGKILHNFYPAVYKLNLWKLEELVKAHCKGI